MRLNLRISCRPLRREDVPECTEITARHPVLGPRYEGYIQDLRTSWLELLGRDSFAGLVCEEGNGSSVRILGASVLALVAGSFAAELKTCPRFWIGAELAKRTARGESPLLSSKEIAAANSGEGVHLITWQMGVPTDHIIPEVASLLIEQLVAAFGGFRLRELLAQAESPGHATGLMASGLLCWDFAMGAYRDHAEPDLHQFVAQPHLMGLSRETTLDRPGSWLGSLFLYEPPQFFFSRSEQRLLSAALQGGTFEELAGELGISVAAIKKSWGRIYERVAATRPDLIPESVHYGTVRSERGRAKKERILAYVRVHPEELRPALRKAMKAVS